MAFSTSDATNKERQPDKGWVLGKLLGLEKEDSSEKKQRPTPSITVFARPSDSPRTDANEYAHSGRGANETDQQEVKGRRRVRRYCSAGHWRCHRPTKKPHRKQKSPKKAHH